MPKLTTVSLKILENNRNELRDHFKFVWSEYMKWFAFFSTFNLGGMTALKITSSSSGFSPVVVAFIAINLIGTGSSIYMRGYSLRICGFLRDAEEEIRVSSVPEEECDQVARMPAETLPAALAVWTALANLLTIVIFLFIWCWIGFIGS